MAEESEVGANERCTGMEPAQFADWMVVGSVLLVLLIVDVKGTKCWKRANWKRVGCSFMSCVGFVSWVSPQPSKVSNARPRPKLTPVANTKDRQPR